MTKIISIFNNKGGVGKTTYMYHVAHLLAKGGRTVLMVDCDSQCNLTAYSLSDSEIKKSWGTEGNSIFRNIEPVYRTTGDIRSRAPSRALHSKGELYIVPGDLRLSDLRIDWVTRGTRQKAEVSQPSGLNQQSIGIFNLLPKKLMRIWSSSTWDQTSARLTERSLRLLTTL